ncbi:hypothetical protein [Burkholderia sp. Ac-20344]|uniref:hypothetical protein n=1 Tax=Burkholderia sp. Ac-20344 TaxID=2703890 RepID=UPI00197C5CF6|nr:hypothetical protein [Burkholderia sp. Ac-20344]
MHVDGERQQILHNCRAIITQLVTMEQGSIAARARPVLCRATCTRCGMSQHGCNAIVVTPASKSALPAASGMIDARHIVDAMTLASSPVRAMRDICFVHFPARHDHHRAMTMRL